MLMDILSSCSIYRSGFDLENIHPICVYSDDTLA